MANMNLSPDATEVMGRIKKSLHQHWRLFLVEGIVLIVLGMAALIVPPIAGLAVSVFVGWLFLIGGAVGLVATLASSSAPGFWWSMFSALLTILAGLLFIVWPFGGVISLTFVLTLFFLFDGVFTIMYAIEHRRQYSRRWGWVFASGLLDLLLVVLIILALPGSVIWALGIIVGIDMLFGGFSIIALALEAREGSLSQSEATIPSLHGRV
jgi:uncharacterized membrane protein HdeD (DUF308 family)